MAAIATEFTWVYEKLRQPLSAALSCMLDGMYAEYKVLTEAIAACINNG